MYKKGHNYITLILNVLQQLKPLEDWLVIQNFSRFQHWRLYCIYFWPLFTFSTSKLGSFPDIEYCFYHLAYQDSKVAKLFEGKCSTLPLLTGTGANKITPLHVGTSYTQISGFTAREMPQVPTWAGSLKPQIVWATWGCSPFELPLIEDTSL